jgi:hypothetical protein
MWYGSFVGWPGDGPHDCSSVKVYRFAAAS